MARLSIPHSAGGSVAPRVSSGATPLANGKIAGFAATLAKGAHVHVEGELRSREYEKDGLTRKILECRVHSILKLDRAAREEQPNDGDDVIS